LSLSSQRRKAGQRTLENRIQVLSEGLYAQALDLDPGNFVSNDVGHSSGRAERSERRLFSSRRAGEARQLPAAHALSRQADDARSHSSQRGGGAINIRRAIRVGLADQRSVQGPSCV